VGSEHEELLPEVFFDLEEVGCLTGEGGAVYFAQSGEPLMVVPSEEEVDGLVGVEPQELAYDLDGEDLGIGELGGWSAPSDAAFLESVVDEAEDADDEGALRSTGRDLLSLRLVWAPPSVGRSPMLFNRSEKLAHGVS